MVAWNHPLQGSVCGFHKCNTLISMVLVVSSSVTHSFFGQVTSPSVTHSYRGIPVTENRHTPPLVVLAYRCRWRCWGPGVGGDSLPLLTEDWSPVIKPAGAVEPGVSTGEYAKTRLASPIVTPSKVGPNSRW
jgi:hypothetical protein